MLFFLYLIASFRYFFFFFFASFLNVMALCTGDKETVQKQIKIVQEKNNWEKNYTHTHTHSPVLAYWRVDEHTHFPSSSPGGRRVRESRPHTNTTQHNTTQHNTTQHTTTQHRPSNVTASASPATQHTYPCVACILFINSSQHILTQHSSLHALNNARNSHAL